MRVQTAVVTSLDQLKQTVEDYFQFDELVFDVETSATRPSRDPAPEAGKKKRAQPKDQPAADPMTNRIGWISLAGPGRADAIPLSHPRGPASLKLGRNCYGLRRTAVFDALDPLLYSDRRKIGQNVKFDLLSIAKYYGNVCPPPPYGDTWALVQLLNENLDRKGGYNLENLAKYYLGYKYQLKLGVQWPLFSFERAARYSILDARMTWLLWWKLRPQYDKPGREKLRALLEEVEMPVIEALLNMQFVGAPVEESEFVDLVPKLKDDRARVEGLIQKAVKEYFPDPAKPFNLDSTPQKRKLLYQDLGLKPGNNARLTDTGELSTDVKSLEPFKRKHPVIPLILEYQRINKILTTYIGGYIPHIEADGRIRATYNPWIPKTGRYSCSGPNLTNVPVRATEDGTAELIRSWFKAPPGWKLVVGDFGQIELRVLAHLSQDPTLLLAFRDELDLHRLTASKIWSIPEADVSKEQRAIGKTCNFNFAFEGGPLRLVDASGIPMAEAKKVYEAWHKAYPGVRRWGDRTKNLCFDTGYVETLFGRRRRLPEIHSHDHKLRAYAERQAVNHPIQGTAADIAKKATILIHRALIGMPANLILQIHDEFVVLTPDDLVGEVIALMHTAMEGITLDGKPVLCVPLVADINSGQTWADAK